MKKFIILSFLVVLFFPSTAQVKIGIRFGGAISTPRVKTVSDTLLVIRDGSSIRPLFGLTVDLPIKDNVVFSSGLGYATKKASVDHEFKHSGLVGKENYRIQYLQLPVLIRFVTNEITPGLKIYFTTGFAVEIKVFDEANLRDPVIVQKFRPIDATFNLGTGIELSLGPDTSLYGGLTYNRGLINSVKESIQADANLRINNDLIGLEVGFRF